LGFLPIKLKKTYSILNTNIFLKLLVFFNYPFNLFNFDEKKLLIENFKLFLSGNRYSFFEENGRIIINHKGIIILEKFDGEIPEGTIFKNQGPVWSDSQKLKVLPEKTEFYNEGDINLEFVKLIKKECIFKNKGFVQAPYLEEISDDTYFGNSGKVLASSCGKFGKNVKFENLGDLEIYSIFSIFTNPTEKKLKESFSKGLRFENSGNIFEDYLNSKPHRMLKFKPFNIEGINPKNILNCYIKQIIG